MQLHIVFCLIFKKISMISKYIDMYKSWFLIFYEPFSAQSVGAIEYTDCFSAEG